MEATATRLGLVFSRGVAPPPADLEGTCWHPGLESDVVNDSWKLAEERLAIPRCEVFVVGCEVLLILGPRPQKVAAKKMMSDCEVTALTSGQTLRRLPGGKVRDRAAISMLIRAGPSKGVLQTT